MSIDVVQGQCVRCGACAVLCPGVFEVGSVSSHAVREPTPSERVFVEAARWICPSDAVRVSSLEDAPSSRAIVDVSFDELARSAERVRWSLESIDWRDLDPARAPAELRAVVREMAFSENATYSATQRFLEAFFDDIDFTQWMSVWFYEETRHPHVLTEWLRRVGESLPSDFTLKGRVSTPFMRSLFGTLVTNVISEVTAAQAYRTLARQSPEPVLARIAEHIARDEARHAATFYRFARKHLMSATPEAARRDRARGVEVLQSWLGGAQTATHPVAEMLERFEDAEHGSLGLGFGSVRTRVLRVVGSLLDLPLRREEDVAPTLRAVLEGRE